MSRIVVLLALCLVAFGCGKTELPGVFEGTAKGKISIPVRLELKKDKTFTMHLGGAVTSGTYTVQEDILELRAKGADLGNNIHARETSLYAMISPTNRSIELPSPGGGRTTLYRK